jgi:hypothetical protein
MYFEKTTTKQSIACVNTPITRLLYTRVCPQTGETTDAADST